MDRVERERVEYFGKETKLEKCTCILYTVICITFKTGTQKGWDRRGTNGLDSEPLVIEC